MSINYRSLLLGLFLVVNSVFAQDEFTKPAEQKLVYDNASVFTAEQKQMLAEKLNRFSRETSTQILVYTTKDLNGYDIADFAQRIGESYGVGQKETDNGIVIVFKPKTATERGQVTIQTGYGIEPLIPDAIANRIIDNEMIPEFKKGNVFEGINRAVDVCISLTKGEFTAKQYEEKTAGGSAIGGIIFFIVFIVTFMSIFRRSKSSHDTMGTRRSNLGFWATMFLLGGSGRGSGWDDFSSGSGSFGGGSSFGGFGGGSFGGGGASGSW